MMKFGYSWSLLLLAGLATSHDGYGQRPPPTVVAGIPVNYDEALVGSYTPMSFS